MSFDRVALKETLTNLRNDLLSWRVPAGHWVGELSSSALSTATAISALALVDRDRHLPLIQAGLNWLARHSNADGGWGDTISSKSNISTTALCWAALGLVSDLAMPYADVIAKAKFWLCQQTGNLGPGNMAAAIVQRFGKDRTFSVPILTSCALAGRLGEGRDAWRWVIPLPFELAALPQRWYKWLRLPVVSYALPALIAIGQVRHHYRPTPNPFTRLLRYLTKERTLEILARIQPESGGFLEAVPLTSFVVMSLAASSHKYHRVVSKGTTFLTDSVRKDGSWPIDTNLSTWVTTLSVNALAVSRDFTELVNENERRQIRERLLNQQYSHEHPYTLASPGGWAWTDLSGGVPDADDTSGALLALWNLGFEDDTDLEAANAGIQWLLSLQNRDGGMPTFCRGWGRLPFDRSSPDITSHALLAFSTWFNDLSPEVKPRVENSIKRSIAYLARVQQEDGSWIPLWFGNQFATGEINGTYGTSRVLRALLAFPQHSSPTIPPMVERGLNWLLSAQNPDGGWGGAHSVPSSVEETALALDALVAACYPLATLSVATSVQAAQPSSIHVERLESAISRSTSWLIEHTRRGKQVSPSPIGFYFANLWYFEKLYPLIFAVGALERVQKLS